MTACSAPRFHVVLLMIGALTATATPAPAAETAVEKPNVLFIAVDDLNDWTNCLGGRKGVYTPNLDRLAARGVLFTNAHCSAPSCNPSRASIMTGVRPSTSGVYVNDQRWRDSTKLRQAATIPQHFRAGGYRAIGSGKIFHALSFNKALQSGFSDPASWDDYYPSLSEQMPDALYPDEPLV